MGSNHSASNKSKEQLKPELLQITINHYNNDIVDTKNIQINSFDDEKTGIPISNVPNYNHVLLLMPESIEETKSSSISTLTIDQPIQSPKYVIFSEQLEVQMDQNDFDPLLKSSDDMITTIRQIAAYLKIETRNGNTCGSNCTVWTHFNKLMDEHDSTQNKQIFYDTYIDNIVNILDMYHHLVSKHKNDKFKIIQNSMRSVCNTSTCVTFKRILKRNMMARGNDKHKNIEMMEDIFDQFHCYFYHTNEYRMRLSLLEQMSPYDTTKNKFSSNLSQIAVPGNSSVSDNGYSFSFPFNYLPKYEHSQNHCYGLGNLKYCDLYVPSRYFSLKEELTQNKICTIDIEAWNVSSEKAKTYLFTQNARKCVANTETYYPQYQTRLNHPIHYGYIDGSPLKRKHLEVIIIYCTYDEFQKKFTETYRAIYKRDTLKVIKNRHSHFTRFSRYIKEAIEVFGTRYMDGKIKRMYHGIDVAMTFDGMQANIYGVLSTTYDWSVAVHFSNNTGLIVELVPEGPLKYFECEWLSPFSFEAELLFVGGFAKMNFTNITHTEFGGDFCEYIEALRIIDNMTHGAFFMNDPSDVHQIQQYRKNKNCKCHGVELLKLNNVNIWCKRLCLALIHHELNKNGYQPTTYKKYSDLHPYVDNLLHQICINKRRLRINWKSLSVYILKNCESDWKGSGYIGYSFMKSLFPQGNELNVLCELFPNLTLIEVSELPRIQPSILSNVFCQLNRKKNKVRRVELITEINNRDPSKYCKAFTDKFRKIGFNIAYGKHSVIIHKKKDGKRIKKQLIYPQSTCTVGATAWRCCCAWCLLIIVCIVIGTLVSNNSQSSGCNDQDSSSSMNYNGYQGYNNDYNNGYNNGGYNGEYNGGYNNDYNDGGYNGGNYNDGVDSSNSYGGYYNGGTNYGGGDYSSDYNTGSYTGGSYNGGGYTGGSYTGGNYNTGSYTGGSYNGGNYNDAGYNGGNYYANDPCGGYSNRGSSGTYTDEENRGDEYSTGGTGEETHFIPHEPALPMRFS